MFTLKSKLIALVAAAAMAIPATAQVTIHDSENLQVYMTLDTVGMLQVLNNNDTQAANSSFYYNTTAPNLNRGIGLRDITPGFQTAYGNMGFGGYFGKNKEIELFYELYLATWNHATTTYGHEGYLIFHGIPGEAEGLQFLNGIFKFIDLKVGMYEQEYGDTFLHRSFNANVKNNPLVGNYVIDPNITSTGAEVRSKKDSPVIFVFGFSSGTTSANFFDGHGTAYNGKIGYQALDGALKGFRGTVSYYRVNHAKQSAAGGAVTNMVSGNRSGARYEQILNNNGGITPRLNKDVTQYQFDIGYEAEKWYVYGNYGKVKDDDQQASASFGNPVWWTPSGAGLNATAPIKAREEWNNLALEGKYSVTKNFYVAARFSTARAKMLSNCAYNAAPTAVYNPANPAAQPTTPMGTCVPYFAGTTNANMNIPTSAHVDRIQLGVGYQMGKHVRIKVEGVEQKYKNFAEGLNYNGMQAWRSPRMHGGLMEFAFYF